MVVRWVFDCRAVCRGSGRCGRLPMAGEASRVGAAREILETVAERPGLSSPCPLQGCQGVVTACSVGFTPPIQRPTGPARRWRPPPLAPLLHLARAPVAPLHRVRCRRHSRIVKPRERVLPRRGQALLACGAQRLAPRPAPPLGGALGERGRAPTASSQHRRARCQDPTQPLSLGEPPADAPQGLACSFVAVTRDAQRA